MALASGPLLFGPTVAALADDQSATPVSSDADQVGVIIEGPGYGGTADELAVTWVRVPALAAAAPITIRSLLGGTKITAAAASTASGAAGAPTGAGVGSEDGGPANPELLETGDTQIGLSIMGVGFRGKSAVTVRVGESDPVDLRTDATGTLDLQVTGVPARKTMPGMSVVAIGRSPSGTTRTLVGAVPPKPSGLAPSDLIPWVAGAAGVLAIGWRVHKTRRNAALAVSQEEWEAQSEASQDHSRTGE